MSNLTKEYLVCKECLPFFHNILEDMTNFVSKEVDSLKQSQMRSEVLKFVHAKKIEMTEQYRILREFITKVSNDLERGDYEFMGAYMSDFMITLNSNEYRSVPNQTGE
jgi:flagellar biosynthesis/type III secretory pathway chaperone